MEGTFYLLYRARFTGSSTLTTQDGETTLEYTEVPQVGHVIAMHLCLQNISSWQNHPRFPSRACKKAYSAAEQVASALHVKAQKYLLKDSSEPGLMQELCSPIDFALRAKKVMVQALRQAMSTLVVQENYL